MRVLHDVQNRPVLNIGASADLNPVDVAANHYARPDARKLSNRDVADNHRIRINVSRRRNLRRPAAVAANHAHTSREIKQVKLTYGPAPYKEGQLAIPGSFGKFLGENVLHHWQSATRPNR